ncbi:hypothetical protein DFJ73DRAFT_761522 [Zopfochytrium polystomum]|nr:hypothetical protein DFJ73DRAFT_761522 [Zopfochytrium polystomum]
MSESSSHPRVQLLPIPSTHPRHLPMRRRSLQIKAKLPYPTISVTHTVNFAVVHNHVKVPQGCVQIALQRTHAHVNPQERIRLNSLRPSSHRRAATLHPIVILAVTFVVLQTDFVLRQLTAELSVVEAGATRIPGPLDPK